MDRCGVSGMNALKDILVDAARYRWLRENVGKFEEELSTVDDGLSDGYFARYITATECDAAIDRVLSSDE